MPPSSVVFLEVSGVLFLALDGLLGHIDEAILGFAVGEVRNSGNGLFSIVVREGAGLFDTIALEDELAGLRGVS